MKFVERSYTKSKEILKFPDHYVNVAVTVDDTGVVANAEGKKIVPAGTIVGGGTLADSTKKVSKKNTQGGASGTAGAGVDAEGLLFYDVDVTYGPAAGAMLIHGFVDLNKLTEAPCADVQAALKGRVVFIK